MEIRIEADQALDRIISKMGAIDSLLFPKLRLAATESAFKIEGEAKKLSPVDTGRMRSSIAVSMGIYDQGMSAIVQTNVNYAVIVHEGRGRGRNSKPRPFMQQGAEASRSVIQKIYESRIYEAMRGLQ